MDACRIRLIRDIFALGGFPKIYGMARIIRHNVCLKKKRVLSDPLNKEASTGFEPVMRVLQTLALPLGHDADDCFIIN